MIYVERTELKDSKARDATYLLIISREFVHSHRAERGENKHMAHNFIYLLMKSTRRYKREAYIAYCEEASLARLTPEVSRIIALSGGCKSTSQ